MESPGEIILPNKDTGKLEVWDIHTGELITSPNTSLTKHIPYSPALALYIASLVRSGKTLKSICEMPNMPSQMVLWAWRTLNPEFKKLLDDARLERADFLHDQLLEEVRDLSSISEEKQRALKLKYDVFKWSNEKLSPKTYGAQKEVSLGGNAPLQIIVNTGIMREDPITVEVKPQEKSIGSADES